MSKADLKTQYHAEQFHGGHYAVETLPWRKDSDETYESGISKNRYLRDLSLVSTQFRAELCSSFWPNSH